MIRTFEHCESPCEFHVLIKNSNQKNYSAAQKSVKVRIRDNSIRLRLMRGEVDDLHGDGQVSADTRFPGGVAFSYRVESRKDGDQLEASFHKNTMLVQIPRAAVASWATTEQVSIKADLPLGDGESLQLLIEKDFECLAPRDGEDESDMYPHPGADEGTC